MSSFLIREFLKLNKMNKTYDMFMEEDTRPKVVMSKNKLSNYLGLETLLRQNAKTKTFNTMLDVISNFLAQVRKTSGSITEAISKASGGVTE